MTSSSPAPAVRCPAGAVKCCAKPARSRRCHHSRHRGDGGGRQGGRRRGEGGSQEEGGLTATIPSMILENMPPVFFGFFGSAPRIVCTPPHTHTHDRQLISRHCAQVHGCGQTARRRSGGARTISSTSSRCSSSAHQIRRASDGGRRRHDQRTANGPPQRVAGVGAARSIQRHLCGRDGRRTYGCRRRGCGRGRLQVQREQAAVSVVWRRRGPGVAICGRLSNLVRL